MRSTLGLCLLALAASTTSLAAQGPLVLMGIDAEDGNPPNHGGTAPYISLLTTMLSNVNNGGSGVLVIGGGKIATDDVTNFWNLVAAETGIIVTQVNGAAAITAASFNGFAVIAVASSVLQTPSGGLTDAENTAFTGRATDVATHVNGGGGLFGTSQAGLSNPYGYLGTVGAFGFNFPPQFSDITATAQGLAVGITNTNLDVCCWHEEYLAFPAFLNVLATNNATGNACAIGGQQVIIAQGIALTPKKATNPVSLPHTVTASVADSRGCPVAGALVTFTVIAGPNTGANGTDTTNDAGQAFFTYVSNGSVGTDTIQGCFVDNQGIETCDTAQKNWVEACFLIIGASTTNWPLPWSPQDVLLVQPAFAFLVTMTNSPAFTIPKDPALNGGHIYSQVYMDNPWAYPSDPYKVSNGLDTEIGTGGTTYGPTGGIQLWQGSPPVLGGAYSIQFNIR